MAAAFDTKGKIFKQMLDAFINDVKDTYKQNIRVDNGRTAEWQQKHHAAHMFLYNAYKRTKFANADATTLTKQFDKFHTALKAGDWKTAALESNRPDVSVERNLYVKNLFLTTPTLAKI